MELHAGGINYQHHRRRRGRRGGQRLGDIGAAISSEGKS
jgi:hypothetical protein